METLVHIGLSNAVLATLLALLAAAVSLVLRRPALCHSLWLLVFLKLLTPPLYRVPVPALAPVAVPVVEETWQEAPPAEEVLPVVGPPPLAPAVRPAFQPDRSGWKAGRTSETEPPPAPFSWQSAVAMAWLTGSLLWWAVALCRSLRFRRFLGHAQPAPADLREQTRRLARRIGLADCPEVWLVPAPVSPLLWALGRVPRLLLPAGLWARLTEEQRASLLVHELAHLRRRDHWVRWLELVVLGLYWWHPVVWWARRRLQDAEEECCDAWVTWALPDAGPAYSSALVETVAFLADARTAVPLGASGGGQARHLQRRLTMILNGTTSRKLHALAFGGVLAVAALLLPLAPGAAEPPDEVQVKSRPKADDPKLPEQAKDLPAAKPAAPKSAAAMDPFQARADHAAANLAEQIEHARDEVELMEANLEVKRAQYAAAERAVAQARKHAERVGQLAKSNAISQEEYLAALQRAESDEAQLLIKRAELREPEVRLMQAKRRLARLEQTAKEQRGPVEKEKPKAATDGEDLRLRRLEMQLDAIKKELDALRRELRPKEQRGQGSTTSTGTSLGSSTTSSTTDRTLSGSTTTSTGTLRGSLSGTSSSLSVGEADRLRRLEMQLDAIKKELDALRRELRPKDRFDQPDVPKI
jgi:beta-lactamase regulating signal transducer with metallopeptidase domain